MPKLNKTQAAKVEKAEEWGQGRELLPEGKYACRLQKVEVRDGVKAPRWSWWLTKPHDEDGVEHSGVLFLNTSLSEAAFGRLKQVFNAFGYTPDSDTDEMLGEWVGVYVTQEVQQQGKNAGRKVNDIQYVFEFDPADWDFDPADVGPDRDRNSGSAGGGRGSEDDAAF